MTTYSDIPPQVLATDSSNQTTEVVVEHAEESHGIENTNFGHDNH